MNSSHSEISSLLTATASSVETWSCPGFIRSRSVLSPVPLHSSWKGRQLNLLSRKTCQSAGRSWVRWHHSASGFQDRPKYLSWDHPHFFRQPSSNAWVPGTLGSAHFCPPWLYRKSFLLMVPWNYWKSLRLASQKEALSFFFVCLHRCHTAPW